MPEPDAPDVTVNHVSELVAVQVQLFGAVTVIEPVDAAGPTPTDELDKVAQAASYDTLTLKPALEAEFAVNVTSE